MQFLLLGPFAQPTTRTTLLAVAGGNVWIGSSTGTTITKAAYASSTGGVISSTVAVSLAYANGVVFIADGSSTLWSYTLSTGTVASTAPVPSPGNITGAVPTFCSYVCNWRGRIVLAGDSNNLQNLYFSRPAGTYFNSVTSTQTFIGPGVDWDYSQTDPAAAFASNLATSGKIGEPVTALIPFSDDYLKVGCSHSLWMYQGDPADGGTCVRVSEQLGIVGKDAWCIDPQGTLWFVATGGLFQVRPAWEFYRPPQPVSMMTVNPTFAAINPTIQRVSLAYDPDLHYVHLFITPLTGAAGTHLTIDARAMADEGGGPSFWPQQFPSTVGPIGAMTFYADGNPNNRTILLGGTDGYIRRWDANDGSLDDDGTAINAYVVLGPYQPVPGQAATLTGMTLNLAETPASLSSTNWNVSATLIAGPTAYDVTEGAAGNLHPAPVISMTLDRRQKTFRQRVRGGFFTIKLANATDNDFFGLESGVLEFIPSGPNRLRR